MSDSVPRASAKVPPAQRLLLLAAAAGLAALLAAAAALPPDARGYGTHQGLGLPACGVVRFFGVRCPSCGMTTAWAHLVRGQLLPAVRANAGGALLGAAALAAIPWSLLSGLRGRWLWRPPGRGMVIAATATIVAVTLIDWGLRLLGAW